MKSKLLLKDNVEFQQLLLLQTITEKERARIEEEAEDCEDDTETHNGKYDINRYLSDSEKVYYKTLMECDSAILPRLKAILRSYIATNPFPVLERLADELDKSKPASYWSSEEALDLIRTWKGEQK